MVVSIELAMSDVDKVLEGHRSGEIKTHDSDASVIELELFL